MSPPPSTKLIDQTSTVRSKRASEPIIDGDNFTPPYSHGTLSHAPGGTLLQRDDEDDAPYPVQNNIPYVPGKETDQYRAIQEVFDEMPFNGGIERYLGPDDRLGPAIDISLIDWDKRSVGAIETVNNAITAGEGVDMRSPHEEYASSTPESLVVKRATTFPANEASDEAIVRADGFQLPDHMGGHCGPMGSWRASCPEEYFRALARSSDGHGTVIALSFLGGAALTSLLAASGALIWYAYKRSRRSAAGYKHAGSV